MQNNHKNKMPGYIGREAVNIPRPSVAYVYYYVIHNIDLVFYD